MPVMKVTTRRRSRRRRGVHRRSTSCSCAATHEIVLVDNRPEMVTSHVMDLDQVLELSPGCTRPRRRRPATSATPTSSSLLSASPLTVGTSRLEYLAKNARIVDELGALLEPDWRGVLLVVTNPVDPLVTRLQRRTGLDRHRIAGYTINDSLRLRTGLARALGVPPGSVEAWAVGEHGDLSVPLLDRVTVDGAPVHPTPEQAAAALEYLRTWYVRHVALDSGRSSTWTSGLGVARMVAALTAPGELWPASVVLAGEYGIDGVAVSVPVTHRARWCRADPRVGARAADLHALRASAEFVRAAVESVG